MSKRAALQILRMLAKEPQHDEVEKVQFAIDKKRSHKQKMEQYVSNESDTLGYIKGTLAAHHEAIKRAITEIERIC